MSTPRMRISMGLPTLFPHERETELAWYRKIDQGPWDGLVTYERLLYPNSWSVIPQLGAAAAMTERVRLWTDVVALPLHNPVLFAKDLATVDVLSGGRLTLGVGIGAWDEDYLAVDSPLDRKRQRMDAAVATMRSVWAQEPPVAGHLPVGPKPAQNGGIPLVAGVIGPKALARAARWADGVSDPAHSLHFDAEGLAAQRERVVEAWRVAGRTDRPHFSAPVWFALGPDPQNQLGEHVVDFWDQEVGNVDAESSYLTAPNAGTLNCGAAGLLAAVNGARAAGLDEIRLVPTTADPDEIDRAREVLGI
ncbi:LLM class flavin-dependent oxidoreductase [[Mycobacterium] wendilense]|uniref:LLM class flavin-dependent oxidoreductase n=1 Tax=[Mycobacterium] wendilense TaxID=3064284 RepID=A0ABN9P8Y5_9MYCO|nr:LLM class flavin-dependent oxidoreductase [Mycolicibacterium sp. MU0050]CAJ1587316.1 LLM class flavin-dependent oxidoreductase [Mycolicibacterium sp. MU0050]